jgi:hypothetical protein
LPDFSYGIAEYIDVFSEEIAFSIGETNGEKVSGSEGVRPSISYWLGLVECWADKTLAQPTVLYLLFLRFR